MDRFDRKLKILFVAPYGGVPGGISRWTSHIVEYHKKYGRNDCDLGLVPMGRSMFVNINMPKWERLKAVWIDYRRILSDFNQKIKAGYDVMHLTSSGSWSLYKDLFMINNARKHGVKSIIHFHFGRIPELAQQNNWEWKLIKAVISRADKAVVLDQNSFDTLKEQGFRNIDILPNPVAPQVEKIVSENKDIKRLKGEILFAGHVVRTKGVFELLEACSELDGITLKMAGHITPEMQSEIEKIYGKPEWLKIYGEIPYEEVIKAMMSCDVFVLPTYTEGFPNVILEAMAAGCAIVTTPVGAIPQILENEGDKHFGVLTEPRNSMALKEALHNLLSDEHLKDAMRINVKKRVRERYNIDSVWNKLLSLWESC